MNPDDVQNFLSRWSRRKLEKTAPAPAPDPEAAPKPAEEASAPTAKESLPAPAEPLPPVESLTPESDFKAFMQPDVDPGLKQAALKQLFKDPHFNVMDGLDTYIDDYSVSDPIPDEMMKKMYQARELLFSPEEKAAANAADAAAEAAEEAERARSAEEVREAFAQPAPGAPAPAQSAGPHAKDA